MDRTRQSCNLDAALRGMSGGESRYGWSSLIGRRRNNEDTLTTAPGFAAAAPEYDFFGVYDGHGGAWVAEACREKMHAVLAEEAARGGVRWPVTAEGEEQLWREALTKCFSRVDGEVCDVLAMVAAESVEAAIGSTAVVALVGPRGILVANCGDSRAVLSRRGKAIPLSSDHKPDRPDERRRVEAAGGRVINWNGYRVLGVLAMSRSIGDYYLKPYVSSEPEITITDRQKDDEFLILASDGLWDVLPIEEACKVVRRCFKRRATGMMALDNGVHGCSGTAASNAASMLARFAVSHGTDDNVSVIIVDLRKSR